MITRILLPIAATLALAVLATAAPAEEVLVYPAKGQSPEQQSKDEGECHAWAKQKTGIDPVALASEASRPAPVASAPPSESGPGGERVRGAARGAAAGAAIGAIAGDAGKGAAAGAAAGTMAGGARKRAAEREAAAQQQRAQQQAQAQSEAQSAEVRQKLATFNKAYAACLEGRGYSVK